MGDALNLYHQLIVPLDLSVDLLTQMIRELHLFSQTDQGATQDAFVGL